MNSPSTHQTHNAASLNSSRAVLIRNAAIVTMDDKLTEHLQGDILIEASKISQIGPTTEAPDAEVVDASGMIALLGSSIVTVTCGKVSFEARCLTGRGWTTFELSTAGSARHTRQTTFMPAR